MSLITQWQSRFKHQWEKPFVSRPFFYVFSSCIVDWHFFHHFAHQQIWNIDISIKTSCCNSADSRLELRCKFGEVAESRLAIDQLRLCHTSDQLGDCYTSVELSWMFFKKFQSDQCSDKLVKLGRHLVLKFTDISFLVLIFSSAQICSKFDFALEAWIPRAPHTWYILGLWRTRYLVPHLLWGHVSLCAKTSLQMWEVQGRVVTGGCR